MLKMPDNYDAQLVTAQRMKPDGTIGVYVGDYEMTPQDLQGLEQWRQSGIAARQAQQQPAPAPVTSGMASIGPGQMQSSPLNFGAAPTMTAPAAPQMRQAMGAPSTGAMPGSNPFTNPLADSITTRVNNTLQRDMLPGIRRNAIANGNFGNAKQGIAEGRAVADASTGLAGQLAQLGYQTYTADQNHQLASDALDLNVYNANQNWARTGQQDQINNLGTFLNWNQTYGVGNTTQTQNTPLNYWQQFSNTGAQLGGMGGTNSQQYDGNPLMGAIGGWQFGSNIFKG